MSATVWFDYFHTVPYNSFTIHERDEAITAAALSMAGAAAAATVYPAAPEHSAPSHAAAPAAPRAPHEMPAQPAGLNHDEQAAVASAHHRLHRERHRS